MAGVRDGAGAEEALRRARLHEAIDGPRHRAGTRAREEGDTEGTGVPDDGKEQTGFDFGAAAKSEPTAAAVSELVRRAILDEAELVRVVAELRDAGRFAFVAETSGENPARGPVVGFGLAGPKGAYYLPIGHRYVGAPAQCWNVDAVAKNFGTARGRCQRRKSESRREATRRGARSVEHEPSRACASTRCSQAISSNPKRRRISTDRSVSRARRASHAPRVLVPKTRGREAGFEEARLEDATILMATRADAVRRLWDKLGTKLGEEALTELFETIELPLAAMLADMERMGVLIDGNVLRGLGRRVEKELEALREASPTPSRAACSST